MPKVLYAIQYVAQGYTPTDACDRAGINWATVKRYAQMYPEVGELFTSAEQRGQDVMADALLTIGEHSIYGQAAPAMASVISGNIKWYLARKRPDIYGDKVVNEVRITADKDVLDALLRAKDRAHNAQTVVTDMVSNAQGIFQVADDTDISSLR